MKRLFQKQKNMKTVMRAFLRDIPLFVELARLKSFTQAAASLNLGVSTLSRRIAQLEEELGVPLFYRNTRAIALTEVGKSLLEQCQDILAESERAWESIVQNMHADSGTVRISMPADCYHGLLRGVLSAFAAQWPDIRMQVNFSEHAVDLLHDAHDIFIRLGPLADASYVARKMFTVAPVLYGPPRIVHACGCPKKPEDIPVFPCISLARTGNSWVFTKGRTQKIITVAPQYTFSSIAICHEFAVAGHGITMLRKNIAEENERDGSLVRLLPEWSGMHHDMYIITPQRQIPRRVRLFVEFILEYCATI